MNEAKKHIENDLEDLDRFHLYIKNTTKYSDVEKQHLQKVIATKNFPKILSVSSILVIWSFMALWVDIIIIPSVIIYFIAKPSLNNWFVALIPALFFLINIMLKFIYVQYKLKNTIKLFDKFLTVLPYLGAAYLLRKSFGKDKLLQRAVLNYLNYRKCLFVSKTKKIFSFKL